MTLELLEPTEGEPLRDAGDERQEWLESRQTGIGATDSPKILGLSRWGTSLTVYDEKVNPPTDRGMSLSAWLGLAVQRTVGELYTQATGNKLRADNRHHRMLGHPHIVCHLDFRAVGKPSLLVECKTKAYMRGWGEDGSTEIPADIWVQVQHEMMVTGAQLCHVAVLFGHHTFRVYPIPRDDDFIEKLIPKLDEWWRGHYEARVPPEPSGHPLDMDRVRGEFPENTEPLKAATPEQEAIVERYRLASGNAAQAKMAADGLKAKLIQIIGNAAGLQGRFGQITYKKDRDRDVVDWEAVAVQYGNVIEELLSLANPGDDDRTVQRLSRAQQLYENAPSLFTEKKVGSRRFLPNFAKES